MHLLPTDGIGLHQRQEMRGHGGRIVSYLELGDELFNLFQHGRSGQVLEHLGSGHDDQVFPDDLTADPQGPTRLIGGMDGPQRLIVKRCF